MKRYISVFSDSLSHKIQNANQIEQRTNIQIVANIAHYTSNNGLSVSHISQWRVEESFRDLSVNLKFLIPKSRNCVIGVTSTIPNEGKTFCAINLGIILAEGGKKVLIIDADLRNPSLVNETEEIKEKGLSNYLKGEVKSVNDIIHTHKELSNLHYIPTKVADNNIHELLSGAKMQSLVHDLKDEYEFIIIDAPAIGLVSDYLLVSSIIDINLFVLRRKFSKISFIADFDKLRSLKEMNNSYIIFNDALGKDYKYGYYKMYKESNNSHLISHNLSI